MILTKAEPRRGLPTLRNDIAALWAHLAERAVHDDSLLPPNGWPQLGQCIVKLSTCKVEGPCYVPVVRTLIVPARIAVANQRVVGLEDAFAFEAHGFAAHFV